MKLANFFLLLISFNLISVERDQLDVDFLSDDEYRIDLIFIKYLKDEELKDITFQVSFGSDDLRTFSAYTLMYTYRHGLNERAV